MAEFVPGVVNQDFLKLYRDVKGERKHVATLAFGDRIERGAKAGSWTTVRAPELFDGRGEWFVKGTLELRPPGALGVLRLSMVDVQQGDGLVLETPGGKIMLVDGGDNKLFARHVAARYQHRRATAQRPLEVEAILVTHGDADHFDGLNELRRSEELPVSKASKRVFLHPKRVLHNGLVKRPSELDGRRVPDAQQFGSSSVDADGVTWATELVDDPRSVPASARNAAFDAWAASLDHWATRGPIDVRRVHADSDPGDVFDFLLRENVGVELLGPIQEQTSTPAGSVPALRFFGAPRKSPELHLEHGESAGGQPSASHTINGHSVALRLSYGNVRFLLTGDLNHAALERLLEHIAGTPERGSVGDRLEAEVVKAPHHGSHEFSAGALAAMKPVVALVSSGDESAFKEYIHPRATLMAALGHAMRGDTGVVLCTELAAFFSYRQQAHGREALRDFFADHPKASFTRDELVELFRGDGRPRAANAPSVAGAGSKGPDVFESFERTNFGIVHVRTDGERVLVFTHSGERGLNEAYRFAVSPSHAVQFENLVTQ
ncbi:MAG TPA: MBL fold metallo-hydrolase [Polyangiaceae bacterium]|nr:MBL fold metallo-hydrolase [Polyangiaceae bacterium]